MKATKKDRDRVANEEKNKMLNPEEVLDNKKRKRKKVIKIILITLVVIIVALIATVQIVRAMGKKNLQKKAEEVSTAMTIKTKETESVTKEEKVEWQEGWIKYNGKVYAYNEDIITFLIMGIDKNSDVKEVAEGTNGGQADALFLVVLNPHDSSMNIIGINRNTIADVDVYNEDGAFVETIRSQIAVQHGFGNGVEESCEYQQKAVSRLMYSLPIHGYAAINMKAIPKINDAVGGVDVVVLEDVAYGKIKLKQGEQVHLKGDQAYVYTKVRDTDQYGSADNRLARQKQYLTEFIRVALSGIKEKPSMATDIYSEISKQMVTNITLDEVAYLAPSMTGYHFTNDNFHMLKGETVMGEKYEEYHVDEDALYDMIIRLFYEEVNQ